jgi:hypothetical protein
MNNTRRIAPPFPPTKKPSAENRFSADGFCAQRLSQAAESTVGILYFGIAVYLTTVIL